MNTQPRVAAESFSLAVAPPSRGLIGSWVRFWFTPADPLGLHAVRVLAGLLFLTWLLTLVGHQEAFFSLEGWFDTRAFEEAANPAAGFPIRPRWSFLYLCGSDPVLVNLAYWGSLGILVLFTLGIWTRLTALLTWVIVVSFQMNPAIAFDGDVLLGILAFYLMIGYVLQGQGARGRPLLYRLLGGGQSDRSPSHGANLALRLLQVHLR